MTRFMHHGVRAKEQATAEKYAKRTGHRVHRATGGRVHEDEAEDKTLVKKMMRERESGKPISKLHRGGKARRKAGGMVPGDEPENRLDKKPRGGKGGESDYSGDRNASEKPKEKYVNSDKGAPVGITRASGGRVHHGKSGKTNIIIHAGGEGAGQPNPQALQQAKMEGAKMGAMAIMQKLKGAAGGAPGGMPGAPPGAAPGGPPMGGAPGGMPPGAPPGMPMRKTGGRIAEVQKSELAARDSGQGRETLREKNHERKGEVPVIEVRGHTRRKAGGKVC